MSLKDKKTENYLHLLNENIPFSQVLLVISKEEKKKVTRQEALNIAIENNLDLFCVSPSANPPVCKLIDHKKYIFDLKKNNKKKKKNLCKEIRISLKIGDHDLKTKLNKVKKWIEDNFTVKVSLTAVGKERHRKLLAREKCKRIITELKNQLSSIQLEGNINQHSSGSFYFFLHKERVQSASVEE
ncbi:translation initiation factor IF-3 [endosymbiont GvMRE of Glomus versiforme]|uniref:translation initiation factor IF-3 n=1 Tax=endosymbiont GvMRE of Glomus versiforme TaxID=2039283 RepID=UPI000EE27B66|nr:translation initiation factor IF-3 [endosymbiont GvMRE of Glomus versiforme]RHZ35449.1 Translation initiation factor IF-3 [endosymbiont GvMRE of Glomus versiforme]